ncbi:dUTP diphosphatase [Virgibacillus halodenitrificans]|uniref:dUTP diphosphatase n=1 Tax=Virgibacillus halodenitrificans TaxID=1482 RepID=UPI000EF45682|nr:dUTP diphosphatase [Virgibacillus halodenitrificans]
MNLQKLFQIQKQLDDRIVKEHGLEGQDLLDKKILALQVELGELANEQRSWKFWSHDQRPRGQDNYLEYRPVDQGGNHWINKNPLLEEYVDGIHFFLSLANDLKINPSDFVVEGDYTKETTTETFNEVFSLVSSIQVLMDVDVPATITMKDIQEVLHEAFSCYVGLAEKFLDFTWEQIEQAYLDKNKINHERQATGY